MAASEEGVKNGIGIVGMVIMGVLVLAVVGIAAFFLTSNTEKLGSTLNRAEAQIYEQYNGKPMKGSMLRTLVVSPSFSVVVFTKKGDGINYGPGYSDTQANAKDIPTLTFDADLGYCTTTDTLYPEVRNDNTAKITSNSSKEFISSESTFYPVLIRDENDTVVGVCVVQKDTTKGPAGIQDFITKD